MKTKSQKIQEVEDTIDHGKALIYKVRVSRIVKTWYKQGPFFSRMTTPLFSFKWKWRLPSLTTLDRLHDGILGFEVIWVGYAKNR